MTGGHADRAVQDGDQYFLRRARGRRRFPIDEIVARIAQVMTLLPGDVIATGTPAGAGPLEPGDRVEVRKL